MPSKQKIPEINLWHLYAYMHRQHTCTHTALCTYIKKKKNTKLDTVIHKDQHHPGDEWDCLPQITVCVCPWGKHSELLVVQKINGGF